jgi:hypothetical protein
VQNEQEHPTTQIQDYDVAIPHQPSRCSDRSQAARENTGKIIITAWGLDCWRNWEYTVLLSRVKSRQGLFLLEELDLNKSYGATQQFKDFISRLPENTRNNNT